MAPAILRPSSIAQKRLCVVIACDIVWGGSLLLQYTGLGLLGVLGRLEVCLRVFTRMVWVREVT